MRYVLRGFRLMRRPPPPAATASPNTHRKVGEAAAAAAVAGQTSLRIVLAEPRATSPCRAGRRGHMALSLLRTDRPDRQGDLSSVRRPARRSLPFPLDGPATMRMASRRNEPLVPAVRIPLSPSARRDKKRRCTSSARRAVGAALCHTGAQGTTSAGEGRASRAAALGGCLPGARVRGGPRRGGRGKRVALRVWRCTSTLQ